MQTYSDEEIFQAILTYMSGSENPDLVGYREQSLQRDLADKKIYMWNMRRLCRLGNLYESKVLDVGCGCGWQALTVSMIGNNSVVASDILPSMIDGVKDCVRRLHQTQYKFDVTPLLGDVCELSLPDDSFDAIYSLEAVEHVHDLGKMFDTCARLLKKAGRLIIVNDTNVLNRAVRSETEAMWQKRENAWEWSSYLKSIRPIEHGEARPFSVMRREIVTAARPSLDASSVEAVVNATAGLLKSDIEAIARDYKPGDSLPKVPELDWCRNPLTGEYAERLLDPYGMAKMLRERGFSVKVLHGFRRWPLRLLNTIQFRPLNMFLFNVRPIFIILAEKTSR